MSKKIATEKELLKFLSEKVDEPIENLKAELEEVVKEVASDEKFKNATKDQIRTIARNRFSVRKSREMASNAIDWEGICIGIGGLIDTVAQQKLLSEAAFKTDPMKTIKGWVYGGRQVLSDNEGNPLYPNTLGNQKMNRVGKPLAKHSWLRITINVARPIDPKTKEPGPPQPSKMWINGQPAVKINCPMNVPIKFKGINKTGEDDRRAGEYRINYSAFTNFKETPELELPSVEQILRGLPNFITLGELDEYHTKNENNPGRWVVTEGNVAMLNLEPNPKTGNLMMIISDESLLFSSEQTGVICWIPTDRGIVVDFAVESRILLVGRTARGRARDPVTGDLLDEPGDVMINVFGIYAPEMFKVAPEVQPVTEESIAPEETRISVETSETPKESSW